MITTAGNGPAPSGFESSTGICSKVPFGVVVVRDGPEPLDAQAAAAHSTRASAAATVRRVIANDCMSCAVDRAREVAPAPIAGQPRDLKYCTARSRASAARRVLNVPRLRRLPVFGFRLRE